MTKTITRAPCIRELAAATCKWRSAVSVVIACAIIAIGAAACSSPATTSSGRHHVVQNGPVYKIAAAQLSGLGTALVDGKGITLYLFIPDHDSSHSVCTALCAVAWPPLILPKGVSAPLSGRGVNAALLGTTTRAYGGVQITYNGWPLYLWPNDTAPGQATGQGLNNLGGLWYVVSAQGSPIR
jgi:predicted lipoprotein with Yx(FWY)xxD motif